MALVELRRLLEATLCHPGTSLEPRILIAAAASHLDRAGAMGRHAQHAFRVAAAIALRQILVDGAGADRVLQLDAALAALAATHPRAAAVAEVRLYGAASPEQIALGLERPLDEVRRDWAFAKAWLWRRMTGRAAGTIRF